MHPYLEDYLRMCDYDFERLDGSTSAQQRQAGIDRFNQEGQGFVYLLSTVGMHNRLL